jgi:hypothetical protein
MLLLLLSCTNAERYTEDLAEARCATYERCDVLGVLGFDGLDHCLEIQAGLEVPECDLETSAAKECVSGWEDISCDNMATEQPQACLDVCPDEPVDTAGDE